MDQNALKYATGFMNTADLARETRLLLKHKRSSKPINFELSAAKISKHSALSILNSTHEGANQTLERRRKYPDREPRVLGGIRRVEADESGTFFLDLLVEVVEVDGLVRGDVAGQHLLDLLRCCRRRRAPPKTKRRRDCSGAGAFGFGPGNSCRARDRRVGSFLWSGPISSLFRGPLQVGVGEARGPRRCILGSDTTAGLCVGRGR